MDKTEERFIICYLIKVRNLIRGKMNNKNYFNVSSVRLMRFLYSLGCNQESYINPNGKENWRFEKSNDLQESLDFYFYMRKKNK